MSSKLRATRRFVYTKRNPVLRLAYILKEAFSKETPVIYDLNEFKVKSK